MKQSPLTFSLVHTTARPWKSAGSVTHDAWLDACANPKDVEYVVTVDKADEKKWTGFHARAAEWGGTKFGVNELRPCPVDGWNKSAQIATGRFLITVSDDLLPCPRWDEEIRKVVPDMSKPVVLDVNYGPKAFPGFLFFNFMSRARYEQVGYLFHADYFGYKADDHFTLESERDKVIVKARHLLFQHLHPDYGLSPIDEIYRRQKSRDLAGQRAFNRHWGANSYADLVRKRDAKYIVRSAVVTAEKPEPGPGEFKCPKCRSTKTDPAGTQRRCRTCTVIFPVSVPAASGAATAAERPRRAGSELDLLRAEVQALSGRVKELEEILKLRSGESAKGELWLESALQN